MRCDNCFEVAHERVMNAYGSVFQRLAEGDDE